jgi:hypothetical protein
MAPGAPAAAPSPGRPRVFAHSVDAARTLMPLLVRRSEDGWRSTEGMTELIYLPPTASWTPPSPMRRAGCAPARFRVAARPADYPGLQVCGHQPGGFAMWISTRPGRLLCGCYREAQQATASGAHEP